MPVRPAHPLALLRWAPHLTTAPCALLRTGAELRARQAGERTKPLLREGWRVARQLREKWQEVACAGQGGVGSAAGS